VRTDAPATADVTDLADRLGKKYGGWIPLAEDKPKGIYAKFA
jgi:hypothetical protein